MSIDATAMARLLARLWMALLAGCLCLAGCTDDDESGTPPIGTGDGGTGGSTSTSGGTTTGTDTGGTGGGTGGGVSDVDVEGYWLWYQHIEDDQLVLQIEDEDLQIGNWPGCPNGIICTHYGIMKLAFGSNGLAHFIFNVMTSSDYQTPGTYTLAGDMLNYVGTERFSCAHPNEDDQTERDRFTPVQLVDGNLWVGVTGFQGFQLPFFEQPTTDPTRWIVFRPISQADFYGKYMIRVCQALPNDPCHPDCSSTSLIGE
jgi:hypothetical protein